MLLLSLKTRVMLKLQFMVVMDTTMMATDCGGISSRWKRPFVFDRSSSYSSGRRGASKRSDYRIMVTGLPSSASWQDLKDHMRRAGDACFSDGYHEAGATIGIVDYTNYEDMKHAIRKLDDSEFRNAFSQAYIRGWEFDARRSRSHSRGRSRSRSN